MNKELETIIEDEFDCLINDLGCLIGEEWKAEAIKKAVTQAFVLGGVSQQRELLLDYTKQLKKQGTLTSGQDESKLVKKYLSNNCG